MVYFGDIVQLFTALYPRVVSHQPFIHTFLLQNQLHVKSTWPCGGDLVDRGWIRQAGKYVIQYVLEDLHVLKKRPNIKHNNDNINHYILAW